MRAPINLATLIIYFFFTTSPQAVENSFTGSYYMRACSAAINMDGSMNNYLEIGDCFGSIKTILSLKEIGMISANSGCLPSNATLDQIARVVVNIMQKNPQIMHLPFPMIVIAAFNAAWPCQAR